MRQSDDPSPLEIDQGPLVHKQSAFSHYPAIPPPVRVSLTMLPDHDCSYLPGRSARSRAFRVSRLHPDLYQQLMDAGFRRSGSMIYQPVCANCRACQPIRIPVNRFSPNKSQRRCWRQTQGIAVTADSPRADREAFDLYTRYVRQWHGREVEQDSPADFEEFLYDSPVESIEFKYRDESGCLLAVGICDVSSTALSSVYFYFDPEQRQRNLGTFGALYELAYAKARKLEHYYLGYWIEGCGTMQYKSRFRPFELLGTNGVWAAAE
jgi:arginyl-tRNA--protein-N-Asp/Glu arginylyltransferase